MPGPRHVDGLSAERLCQLLTAGVVADPRHHGEPRPAGNRCNYWDLSHESDLPSQATGCLQAITVADVTTGSIIRILVAGPWRRSGGAR